MALVAKAVGAKSTANRLSFRLTTKLHSDADNDGLVTKLGYGAMRKSTSKSEAGSATTFGIAGTPPRSDRDLIV